MPAVSDTFADSDISVIYHSYELSSTSTVAAATVVLSDITRVSLNPQMPIAVTLCSMLSVELPIRTLAAAHAL